jgi:hypothetical protein
MDRLQRMEPQRDDRWQKDDRWGSRDGGGGRREMRHIRAFEEDIEQKPVMRLDDPASVPKGRGYFEHDNRGADSDRSRRDFASDSDRSGNRGRRYDDDRSARMYDPRSDYGGSRSGGAHRPQRRYNDRERDRGDQTSAPMGWRNVAETNVDSSRRSNNEGGYRKRTYADDDYSHPYKRSTFQDDVWGHDKFFELLEKEEKEEVDLLRSVLHEKESVDYHAEDERKDERA